MDRTLVKAVGVAALLHLLMGAAASQLLNEKLLQTTLQTAAPEPLAPIAIEFLPPPSEADPPSVKTVATSAEVASASQIAPTRRTRMRRRTRLGEDSRPRTSSPVEPGPSVEAHPIPKAGNGSLSMRSSSHADDGMGAPLDLRIARSQRPIASARPGHERPDLVAGVPQRERSSAWRPSGGGTMRATGQPFDAKIHEDGTIEFRDKPNVKVYGLTGSFDVTDAVMASLGESLYPHRKMKLMDESREVRSQMAKTSKAQNLRQAPKHYQKHLRRVWSHPGLSIAERRRALFLLWDECAETGGDTVVASARAIRTMTLAFIRRTIPKGSEHAYTSSELREFNRTRRSSARFTPY